MPKPKDPKQQTYELAIIEAGFAGIGAGASAIPFVPEIAPEVAQLYLFQRMLPWITPKNDKKISRKAQLGFKCRKVE